MKKNLILWEGNSLLDNAPIAVIALLSSNNRKTGDNGTKNMVQTVIIRTDIDPVTASKNKQDESICGSCIHRQSLGGACYVNLGQMPLSVYRAYKRGSYEYLSNMNKHWLYGRALRLGAYGDPAAIPVEIWSNVINDCKISHYTGYTHQLNYKKNGFKFNKDLTNFCMISADTPKQAKKIRDLGYRTFRVKTENSPIMTNEIECLSDTKGIKCIDCGLCDGIGKNKTSIVIDIHGSRKKSYVNKYEKVNVSALA
jgi:hypothetical protein